MTVATLCYDLQGFPMELTPQVIPCCIVRIFEESSAEKPARWDLLTSKYTVIWFLIPRKVMSLGAREVHWC